MQVTLNLERLQQIPTVPAVLVRLIKALTDPDAPMRALAEIIKSDPAITARIIKAANSSVYAGLSKVDTLERCVLRLGKNAVGCLALSFSLADRILKKGPHEGEFRDTWLHCVIQATAMEYLSREFRVGESSHAFLCGLLMDLGRLAMIQNLGDEYVPLLREARSGHRPLRELERRQFGMDHGAIARELMQQWQFPESISIVAANHDLSLAELGMLRSRPEHGMIALANAATATAEFLSGISPAAAYARMETVLIRHWNATGPAIVDYVDSVRQKLDETSELLSVDTGSLPDEKELLALAMEQMVGFSLRDSADRRDFGSEQLAGDQDEIRHRLQLLEQRSCRDSLTGVYNRDYFQSRLMERLKSSTGERAIGVLFVDLDHFKNLNDTFGHLTGDEVLKAAGAALQDALRAGDIVARFGGEEFVVLLECRDGENVPAVAERIRSRIESMVILAGEISVPVTASIGGVHAIYAPGSIPEAQAYQALVHGADSAMYASKAAGRNRCTVRPLDFIPQRAEPHAVPVILQTGGRAPAISPTAAS